MDLGLKNKVALVTGASRGIGFEIAKSLNREGCRAVLNSRNEQHLKQAGEAIGENTRTCVADVTVPSECQRLVSKTIECWGQLDILVCNVGLSRSAHSGQINEKEWQEMLSFNLFSMTNMIECARPYLQASKGCVICISSICGNEVIPGAPITYSAAKAALNMSIKSLARPLGKEAIRINAVAPGNILFKGSSWDKKLKENPEKIKNFLQEEVALQRFGAPQEIADMVVFLASPRSAFTTGAVFVLDGGQSRG